MWLHWFFISVQAVSRCRELALLFVVVSGLLIAEHRLLMRGLQ